MSASNIKDILGSRRRMVTAAAWMLALVAALSAATYAWFSNSRYTNVTPVAHAVSDESSDLQIGLSSNGNARMHTRTCVGVRESASSASLQDS